MTDQERPDHWALLASELGAEPPPEKEAGDEQPSAQEIVSEEPKAPLPEGPRYSFTRPETQRTASDWLRLAEHLGAAVDAETISQTTEETTSTEVVEQQTPASVIPPEPPTVVMEPVEADGAVVDVVDVFSEGDEQLGDQLVDRVDTEAVEEQERPDKKRRRRRRRRRPRKPEEARETIDEGETSAEEEEEGFDNDVDESDVAASSSESLIVSPMSPDPTETPSRGRRRRRRRSSGKKKEGAGAAETPADIAVDQSLLSVTGEAALVPVDEPEFEMSHAVLGDEDDHAEGTDEDGIERPIHRGIPTWDEAVGIVITRNMEARAKNPGGQQRSRGNRGRN